MLPLGNSFIYSVSCQLDHAVPSHFVLVNDLTGSMLTVTLTDTLWSLPTLDKGVRCVLGWGGNQCRRLTHKMWTELPCKQLFVIPHWCLKDRAPPIKWLVKFLLWSDVQSLIFVNIAVCFSFLSYLNYIYRLKMNVVKNWVMVLVSIWTVFR